MGKNKGRGKVYTTSYGKVRVVRVGNLLVKFDSKGNEIGVKAAK